MAVNDRLLKLLRHSGAKFEVLPHHAAYSAQDVARSVHIPGRVVAKVVVLRDEMDAPFMAVVPATTHLAVDDVRRLTRRHGVELATENEIIDLFPDCAIGAMPPFGHLYGMPAFIDPCLLDDEVIFFQAGNHHEVVGMRRDDFLRLARPVRLEECVHHTLQPAYGF